MSKTVHSAGTGTIRVLSGKGKVEISFVLPRGSDRFYVDVTCARFLACLLVTTADQIESSTL